MPGVIEPSFGIGRIVYCILEHTFRSRGIQVRARASDCLIVLHQDQEERCFLALPTGIAPVKCSLLPISADDKFLPIVQEIKSKMVYLGVSCKVDISGATIGKYVFLCHLL